MTDGPDRADRYFVGGMSLALSFTRTHTVELKSQMPFAAVAVSFQTSHFSVLTKWADGRTMTFSSQRCHRSVHVSKQQPLSTFTTVGPMSRRGSCYCSALMSNAGKDHVPLTRCGFKWDFVTSVPSSLDKPILLWSVSTTWTTQSFKEHSDLSRLYLEHSSHLVTDATQGHQKRSLDAGCFPPPQSNQLLC